LARAPIALLIRRDESEQLFSQFISKSRIPKSHILRAIFSESAKFAIAEDTTAFTVISTEEPVAIRVSRQLSIISLRKESVRDKYPNNVIAPCWSSARSELHKRAIVDPTNVLHYIKMDILI